MQGKGVLVHFSTSCLQPVLLSKSFNHDNCCPSEYVNCDIFIQLQNIFTDHSRLSTTMKLVSSKYRTIIQKQPAILQHVLAFGTPSPFKTYVRESFAAQPSRGASLPYAFGFVAVSGPRCHLGTCPPPLVAAARAHLGVPLLAPFHLGRERVRTHPGASTSSNPTRSCPSTGEDSLGKNSLAKSPKPPLVPPFDVLP